ncbi:protein of unknown function [Pararobbsia alpina]|uniref:hypothetical protein n=1 Tax=Pararobbsia alpina TaxID=621374 RepID=UPI0039A444F5
MSLLSYSQAQVCAPATRSLQPRASLGLWLVLPVAMMMSACSSTPKVVKVEPVSETRTDLTPTRSTADNMVRLDAQLRSGCPTVTNIDRPDGEPTEAAPQIWTAHTCRGDLVYNVASKPGPNGPVVEVTPAGGAVDKPANPHFTPAMPDDPSNAQGSAGQGSSPDAASEPEASPAK